MSIIAPKLFVVVAAALWVCIGVFIANPSMFDGLNFVELARDFVSFHRDAQSGEINGASEAIALAILLTADVMIASVILKENRASASMTTGLKKALTLGCAFGFLLLAIFMPMSRMPLADSAAVGGLVALFLITVRAISYATPKEFVPLE